ncbi:MAG: hypothetical protein AAB110_10015, partial [Candidatus Desantisbacteria bacterium]
MRIGEQCKAGKCLSLFVIISCLSAPFAYGYEDFSGTHINSSDDIWELVENSEISSGYAQFLAELYDNPFLITNVSKEDLNNLSILSPEEIEKLLEYQRNLITKGSSVEALPLTGDIFETIKPFLTQRLGQDNRLRLTHSSYQQGQTAESLKVSFNSKTQLYLWNKDT